jgi:hypothetical protein
MFNSEWKESSESTLELPHKSISDEAFEAFLLFLYTNCIKYSILKEYLLDLFDLADYFQVEMLKKVALKGMKNWLTMRTANVYLPRIRNCNVPDLVESFTTFISSNQAKLYFETFPFHQLGKTLLWIAWKTWQRN